MICTVTVEATYSATADEVFESAMDLSEMREAMRGLAVYDGLPDHKVQEGETLRVDVTFLKLFKNRDHVMLVERLDRDARILQSREHNRTITRWDHTLSVQPAVGGCLWRDTIVLDAGAATWMTARFCRFVYSRRHRVRKANTIRTSIQRGDASA
ncbi:MAG: hypothetical protein AB8B60_02075 [Sulfitobacter sp.]